MSLAHNALYVTNSANYKFNPGKANNIQTNAGAATEPFVESFTYSSVITGKGFVGHDIGGNFISVTVDVCKQACDNNQLCKGFSIRKSNSECYLKNAIPQGADLKADANYDTYIAYPDTYTTINNHTINPVSGNNLGTDATATESDIEIIKLHQTKMAAENAVKQSLLDEINSNINYTVMSMTILIPFGILAGYYLYKKNVGVPQPV